MRGNQKTEANWTEIKLSGVEVGGRQARFEITI